MILDVQRRDVGSEVTVLEFSGRMQLGNDLGLAEGRIRKLLEAGRRHLVFDCSRLEGIDSAGVGMLVVMSASTIRAGGQFRLAALTPRVAEVLQIARVHQMLGVCSDVEAALQSLEFQDLSGAAPAKPLNEAAD